MKKSKFLKKSLAMLLALMLVVAMIPLSAAAEGAPGFSDVQFSEDGGDNYYSLNANSDGKGYTATLSNTTKEINLRVMMAGDAAAVVSYRNTESTSSWENFEVDDTNQNYLVAEDIDLTGYLADGSATLEIRVQDANDSTKVDNYTITLTQQAESTDASLNGITLWAYSSDEGDGTPIPQLGATVIDNQVIKITMPYEANGYDLYVHSISKPEGSTVYYDSVAPNNVLQVVNDSTGTPVGTEVADKGEIYVTNGDNTKKYTLSITFAPGAETFTAAEAVDYVVFPTDNAIAILLPYGYTEDNRTPDGKLSLTPVFELDYPSAKAYWGSTELTSGETKISVDEDQVNDWLESGKAQFAFSSVVKYEGDDTLAWNKKKASANGDFDSFDRRRGNVRVATTSVDIVYSDSQTKTYDVYVYETQYNDQAAIKSLSIGSEQAEIDQETRTINITLPAGTNKVFDPTAEPTKMTIEASDDATITLPDTANTGDAAVTFTDADGRGVWSAFTKTAGDDDTIDANGPVILRVTSEDGVTTVDYKLNVTVSDNYVDPQLTSMDLVAPDGTPAKLVSSDKDTFVFEVPYDKTDRGDLANWTLFYTKTLGATAVEEGTGNALPISGSKLDGTEAYLPADLGKNSKGSGIVVRAVKADGTYATRTYHIVINRATPSEVSTLESFDLTSAEGRKKANMTERNTYEGTIDGKKIVVDIPWSDYQQNDLMTALGAALTTTDDGAKVFLYNEKTDYLYPFKEITDTQDGTAFPGVDSFNGSSTGLKAKGHQEGQDPIKLVVLSERSKVDVEYTGGSNSYVQDWSDQKSEENKFSYTEYDLYINQDPAQKGNTMSELTLVDGTGWEKDLKVNFEGGAITGTVPYALTSKAGTQENPIYLDYTLPAGSDLAFVLANVNGKETTPANTNDEDLPTAGAPDSNGLTGIFYDISDYTAYYDETTKKNGFRDYDGAYLILERGDNHQCTVKVYSGTSAVTGVEGNKIAVTNEDGKEAYQVLTFTLTYKDPNKVAEFESFSINGYQGEIDTEKDTITVTLPFGSEFTYLTPEFTLSDGATVQVDDPDLSNVDLRSGVNAINFSTERRFTITAEDETTKSRYVVKVVVSDEFFDVTTDDWFYTNVMEAAANGYITGSDGYFKPYDGTTRAQFASMIAKVLGFDDSEDETAVETAFVDVPADHWGAAAIAFVAENEIMNGDPNGKFRPDDSITRQEVAAVLKNAFDLTETTSELFTDDADIASWAKENVYLVKAAGLMAGDLDTGKFRPNDTIIRAESASIMMSAKRAGLIK